MDPRCKAEGCTEPTRPEYVMCKRHWFMVPPNIRRRIARHPTSASRAIRQDAIAAAVKAVWELENSVVLKWSGTIGGGGT